MIYVQQAATSDYWDEHWHIDQSIRDKLTSAKSTWVTEVNQRYLKPEDGLILEGGCGTAIHVAALVNNGYQCIGVDYASRTVQTINKTIPELIVQQGDVRNLQFEDSSFVGYWSLGVIEHFWEGYRQIAMEMERVIKPGGYLFLTFPYLSPLRRLKARLNLYPKWNEKKAPPSFYQFALDHTGVIEDFRQQGFELLEHQPMLGFRAIKEELGILNPLLCKLYDYRGQSILIRGFKFALSQIATPLSGHMILLVFRKRNTVPVKLQTRQQNDFHSTKLT